MKGSRKELIKQFNEHNKICNEIAWELNKRYTKIVHRYKDNEKMLHKYLDECPNCMAKLMFYQRLREIEAKKILRGKKK
jgi:hypothetical protein